MCRVFHKSSSGGTLIEVMAAVALLGGIFASSLRAVSSLTSTRVESANTLQAVEIIDRLLNDWMMLGDIPLDTEGTIDSKPGWVWRTSSTSDSLGSISTSRVLVVVVAADGITELAECEVLLAASSDDDHQSDIQLHEDARMDSEATP